MSLDINFTKEMIEVLEYLFDKFGIVVDWSNNEIIPYVKELAGKIVAYKSGVAWLWIVVGAIALIVGVVGLIIALNNGYDGWAVISVLVGVVGIVLIICFAHTVIACKTFPEKVVLDYIQNILEKSQNMQ